MVVCFGAVERRRSRSRDKVNHHHHYVLHVCHLGHFLHVPRVGHLAQYYCFLSILYNWANATGGGRLYVIVSFLNISYRSERSALCSVPALLVVRSHVCD